LACVIERVASATK